VIGVVFSFVGDALKSVLTNREQTILTNINEAEKRADEAQAKLMEAQQNFENSKQKALEVQKNSFITAEVEVAKCQKQGQEDIERLYKVKDETILFQEQKIIKEISQQIIRCALQQVYKKLENRYDDYFQNSVNNFYIALFRNYQI